MIYEQVEFLFLIYCTILIIVLLLVSFKEKERLVFSHYPMFSNFFSNEAIPKIYKIEITMKNNKTFLWTPPITHYGKTFGNQFYKVAKAYLLEVGNRKLYFFNRINLYLTAILKTVPKNDVKAINILEVKSEANQKTITSIKLVSRVNISILSSRKYLSWKIISTS